MLASLASVQVPTGTEVELLLVDNGSSDATADVIRGFCPGSMDVRHLWEPRPGKSRALNRAIPRATGDIFLFTDDDVRFPVDWIAGMIRPLLWGEADAVAGGVRLASHLQFPGMTPKAASLLASTDGLDPARPQRLVGANMAVHRRVFEVIAGFDVELGPGRLGLEEDTLLSLQMRAADMRIVGAFDVAVEHHPGDDRLRRDVLIQAVERLGRSDAYVSYHWRHENGFWGRSRMAVADSALRLTARRLVDAPSSRGISDWEHALVRRRSYHQQMISEYGSPRNYCKFGFRRKGQ